MKAVNCRFEILRWIIIISFAGILSLLPLIASEATQQLRVGAGETYLNINSALSVAESVYPGERVEIVVAPGIYHENITINSPQITLRGAGQPEEIIVQAADPAQEVLQITAKQVRISNLTLTGAYNHAASGVRVQETEMICLENIKSVGNARGIYYANVQESDLRNSIISSNSEDGITIWNSQGIDIQQCVIAENNTREASNFAGLRIIGASSDLAITNNSFTHNSSRGVWINSQQVTAIQLQWNNFMNNGHYGLSSAVPVTATFNWWNSFYGPQNGPLYGNGDGVDLLVKYSPWLGQKAEIKPSFFVIDQNTELSITEVINDYAAGGDTVALYPGTYEENIVIDQGVRLAGVPGLSHPQLKPQAGAALYITANDVLVKGLHILQNKEHPGIIVLAPDNDKNEHQVTIGGKAGFEDLEARNIFAVHAWSAPFLSLVDGFKSSTAKVDARYNEWGAEASPENLSRVIYDRSHNSKLGEVVYLPAFNNNKLV